MNSWSVSFDGQGGRGGCRVATSQGLRGHLGRADAECQRVSHPIAFRAQVTFVLRTSRGLEGGHRHLKSPIAQRLSFSRVVCK